jgi:ABC-type cobalamin/Fe3+-siderophores transport system ATPase subunit
MVLLANAKKPAAGVKIQAKHIYQKPYKALQQQFSYLKQRIIEEFSFLIGLKDVATII